MRSKRHSVVLHGAVSPDAPPDEQDVLDEVAAVSVALKRLGHTVDTLPLSLDLHAAHAQLDAKRPDLVFNLVESVDAKARFAPFGATILEELGLAYTGTPSTGLFLSSNKLLAKRLFMRAGISTPAWCLKEAPAHAATDTQWIIKSVWEQASVGIDDDSVVDTSNVAFALAARRQRFGGEWFAEQYIEGREFNLALIDDTDEPQVLPPAEIHFIDFPQDKPHIVGYAAKWTSTSFEYRHTLRSFKFPDSDRTLLATLSDAARRCWSLFECRGYARVDFRVDRDGRPWVLEVNANPCLTPDAGFAAAARQMKWSFNDVIARIIKHVPHP